MKKIILVSILLLITAQSAIGELTEKDLEKISNLLDRQEKRIKEYVDLKIEAVRADVESLRTEMRAEIKAVRADIESLRTEMRAEIKAVRAEIGATRAEMRAEIRAMKWFIAVLIVIIVALIGIPQTVQLWRERKESKEIDMLNREIERVNRNYERLEQQLKELKERKFFVGS